MKNTLKTIFASAFEEDVYLGLTSYPKYLLSKYIYDKKGDKLFQDIMNMPEYYLTNSEYSILHKHSAEIAEKFQGPNGFDLVELGAGDGKKTKVLLKKLVEQDLDFNYLPIDISSNVLEELEASLKTEIPQVRVKIQQGTYIDSLKNISELNSRKKCILVLGSNIGNLLHKDAIQFLKQIQEAMNPEDMMFMGFDQKKDPQIILNAYNDATGITEAFNKNLLSRVNSELGGNFDLDQFSHWETYDPESGTAKSFLLSQKEQQVQIKNLGITVHFTAWETIHTEISQKYDDSVVEWLAEEAGLKVTDYFMDEKKYYKNYIFRKKQS